MSLAQAARGPWYREPWPWLLMAGPATVILAGAVTIWLAFATEDGLVVDEYYKQGLAINQTLQRNAAASRGGYRATLELEPEARRFLLVVSTGPGEVMPDSVRLRFAHPTRVGHDQVMTLRGASGRFEGTLAALPAGQWQVLLEDPARQWRLSGRLSMPGAETAELTAQVR